MEQKFCLQTVNSFPEFSKFRFFSLKFQPPNYPFNLHKRFHKTINSCTNFSHINNWPIYLTVNPALIIYVQGRTHGWHGLALEKASHEVKITSHDYRYLNSINCLFPFILLHFFFSFFLFVLKIKQKKRKQQKMNVVHTFFTVPGAVLILILAWRVLNMIWLKPRKAEKLLRKQGLRGNSYRFLYGDKKDISRMESEARAKPIHFTHDIVPRVLPFIQKTINTFGIFHFCLDFYYQLTFLIF